MSGNPAEKWPQRDTKFTKKGGARMAELAHPVFRRVFGEMCAPSTLLRLFPASAPRRENLRVLRALPPSLVELWRTRRGFLSVVL